MIQLPVYCISIHLYLPCPEFEYFSIHLKRKLKKKIIVKIRAKLSKKMWIDNFVLTFTIIGSWFLIPLTPFIVPHSMPYYFTVEINPYRWCGLSCVNRSLFLVNFRWKIMGKIHLTPSNYHPNENLSHKLLK